MLNYYLDIANWTDDILKHANYDPPNPPGGTLVLWGYVGRAENKSYGDNADDPDPKASTTYRLYRNLQLTEYFILKHGDVLASLPLDGKLGGTAVWLKPDAEIDYVRTDTREIQGAFLQGPITNGMSAALQQQRPGMLQGATGPGVTLGCGGPGVTLGCGGPGVTLGCGGPGVTLGCVTPGITFACGGPGVTLGCGGPGVTLGCVTPGVSLGVCW